MDEWMHIGSALDKIVSFFPLLLSVRVVVVEGIDPKSMIKKRRKKSENQLASLFGETIGTTRKKRIFINM